MTDFPRSAKQLFAITRISWKRGWRRRTVARAEKDAMGRGGAISRNPRAPWRTIFANIAPHPCVARSRLVYPWCVQVRAIAFALLAPSPGTPGEGWGEGSFSSKTKQRPSPYPLPEYREREKQQMR